MAPPASDSRRQPRMRPVGPGIAREERPKERGLVADVDDFNAKIIEEFRANSGKVGGNFDGAPLLLLHTKGAKTGAERINPVVYLAEGDRLYVFASKAGAPTNPDWFHNLVADPNITVEVGGETVDVVATVVEGAERDRLYHEQASRMPGFADYEAATDRAIPVVALDRH
jgi:deazaflavin-dependent oxidoreductase (nitroreductase family)